MSTIEATAACPRVLYCPNCKDPLSQLNEGYACQRCACSFSVIDGIPSFVDRQITTDSFDASAFEFLFKMEQKHFWHVGRREIILDALRRNTANLPASRMLEVGCGNGSVLAFLMQHGVAIAGGDVFLEGLRFCRKRVPPASLYQIDILALPFRDEFDIVGAFDVLEHVEDDEKALAEANRALKRGGTLVLTVPAHQFLWSRHDEASHHKRRYSRSDLMAKLERSGFTVNKVTYYMFFLFPVMAAMRLLSRVLRGKRQEKSGAKTSLEMKTVPVVNDVFLAFLRLEKHLIRYVNLPFGASLLITAAKNES